MQGTFSLVESSCGSFTTTGDAGAAELVIVGTQGGGSQPVLKAATLPVLVRSMFEEFTLNDGPNFLGVLRPSPQYLKEFILIHDSVIPACPLLRILIDKCKNFLTADPSNKIPMLRCCMFVKNWLSICPESLVRVDNSFHLLHQQWKKCSIQVLASHSHRLSHCCVLSSLPMHILVDVVLFSKPRLESLLLLKDFIDTMPERIKSALSTSCSKLVIPPIRARNETIPPGIPSRAVFPLCSVDSFCEQLTLMESNSMSSIQAPEFLLKRWETETRDIDAPNITGCIEWSDRLSNAVLVELLSMHSLQDRVGFLSYILQVADQLHKIGNFSSITAILAAVQHKAVQKLTRTWGDPNVKHYSSVLPKLEYDVTHTAAAHRYSHYIPYIGMH
ncbi:RasGEF domain [Pelomyxa schiedti]|nr:RasGEF domain [Pelomyxa schiedti]